jgi:hypothetical protein
LRDIEKHEEITITYLRVLNNREARQEALQRKFAFSCSRLLCSLPSDQSQESDVRLDGIFKLDGLGGRDGVMGILSTPLRILRYVVDQQIQQVDIAVRSACSSVAVRSRFFAFPYSVLGF